MDQNKILKEVFKAQYHQKEQNKLLKDAVTALYQQNLEIFRTHIDDGLDVNLMSNGQALLHIAVNINHTNIVKLLLDRGADLNAKDNLGYSPLQNAVRNGQEEMVRILLDAGADIRTTRHILYLVVEKGYKDLIKLLLDRGADANAKDRDDKTLLLVAGRCKNDEIANILLDAGADIDTTYILNDAVAIPNKKLTKLLLNKGANVNAKNGYGKTPLQTAVLSNQDEEMVNILLDAGANVNARDICGQSVLYKAIWKSKVPAAVIQLLISKGANINIKTDFGNTPLYEAALWGKEELVKMLLKKGALVNAARNDGKTPLFAAKNGKIAEILLENGADINAKTISGKTVLCEAVCDNNKSVVQLLLNRGANVNAKSNSGTTALYEAVCSRHISMVQLLLSNGADVNAKIRADRRANGGMTPLLQAVSNGDKELAEILLNKGADISAKTSNNQTALSLAISNALKRFHLDKAAGSKQNCISFASFYEEQIALIKCLLDHGADINNTFVNLLLPAIKCGRKDIVNFVLANGGNININSTDSSGRTAIHEAAAHGVHELVENLLSRGAKINARNSLGETPLHIAVKRTTVFNYGGEYISSGVDPLLVRTVYYGNLNTEHCSTLRLLLNNGADLEAVNKSRETPLVYLVKRNDNHTVDFLLNNGANINHSKLDCICAYSSIDAKYDFNDVTESMVKLLREHIIKRKCARMFINKKMSDLFPFGMIKYQTECSKEITKINNTVIYNHISLYDVLIKPTKQLVGYLNDENFVQSIKLDEYKAKFPKYYEMIKYSIQNGLRHKDLLKCSERFLNCVFGSMGNLPYICCTRILSYLSKEDLVTLEIIVKCK